MEEKILKLTGVIINTDFEIRAVGFNPYLPTLFFLLTTYGGLSSEDLKFTCPILLTDSSCAIDFCYVGENLF